MREMVCSYCICHHFSYQTNAFNQSVVVMLYLVHVSYCTVIDLFDMIDWFKTGIKEGHERK